ncbi:mannitol dehydrogenase family protein [Zafaria sp. J156]|nr:mannitol dehydrogenase family protein [Zafaria sp. J156]MEE1621807.1 mannitol dehydrogenase family protein [Zafaria sp. J156]
MHLGLGAFHRAHQAWYTEEAGDGWGIAAFTGRSADAARQLSAQDGLYTLVERTAEGDRCRVIGSIVEAHDGADLQALATLLAHPDTAIVTLTVTEAGYRLAAGGEPALDAADELVAADAAALAAHYEGGSFTLGAHGLDGRVVRTVAGRLVVGLAARRAADGWPLAVVSCDNLPGNGAAAKASLLGMARLVDPLLAGWIEENVSFVDTSIDRITPRTTDADRAAVAEATGYDDVSPVVTEPFSSWVLAGDFPAGRPAWEKAGAVFVEDLEAFERRKLWLLNGAHSLMAYAGRLRGHATVADALADPAVSAWVEEFWDAAAAHLTAPELDVPAYRAALRERFENPRIAHHLSQIGMDGTLKLAARAVPVYRAEREAGRAGTAALRPIAAWMDQVCAQLAAGEDVHDRAAGRIAEAAAQGGQGAEGGAPASSSDPAQTTALLALVDSGLASEPATASAVHALRGTLTR